MKKRTIFVILVINLILQSTLFQFIKIFNIIPNTSLILIVSFALLKGEKFGAYIGLFTGLLQDILYSDAIGVFAFVYFIIGYSVGWMNQKVFKDNLFIPFIFTILATVSYHLFYGFIMYFLAVDIHGFAIIKSILIPELIINSLLSMFIYSKIRNLNTKPSTNYKMLMRMRR
ncbi:rod shape-determining protein MreD [Thermohalobacter berrensis]|uniref:Rod shape-determining protein MreD n=1 Tax=Thermohalobacter berrensis TaxID=99594 RepID=A0A419T6Y2_9FIRM|nr:rod shape-determining protein MreD [Thermohalobacter berrensis]RKD33202.1 rod shape-determining protein MreD [Thermohalobacter berrensis]